MLTAGVDEAGRGPVIGPMVVAGVAGDEAARRRLKEMGVRDSKELTPKARQSLAKAILREVKAVVFVVPPAVIDANVKKSGGNLNQLEAFLMGEAIAELRVSSAVVDALGSEEKFAEAVGKYARGVQVRASHDADASEPLVSAASILAKVIRDCAVQALGAGSGYPSDPHTREFLRKVGRAPSFVRKSWGANG